MPQALRQHQMRVQGVTRAAGYVRPASPSAVRRRLPLCADVTAFCPRHRAPSNSQAPPRPDSLDVSEGHFTWLHGLPGFTIVTVTLGLMAAIRGHIGARRGNMASSYIGLAVAFVFAAGVPGRRFPGSLPRAQPPEPEPDAGHGGMVPYLLQGLGKRKFIPHPQSRMPPKGRARRCAVFA